MIQKLLARFLQMHSKVFQWFDRLWLYVYFNAWCLIQMSSRILLVLRSIHQWLTLFQACLELLSNGQMLLLFTVFSKTRCNPFHLIKSILDSVIKSSQKNGQVTFASVYKNVNELLGSNTMTPLEMDILFRYYSTWF